MSATLRILKFEDPYHVLVRRHLSPFIGKPGKAELFRSAENQFLERCRAIFERSRPEEPFSEEKLRDAYVEYAVREMHISYEAKSAESHCLSVATAILKALRHDFQTSTVPLPDHCRLYIRTCETYKELKGSGINYFVQPIIPQDNALSDPWPTGPLIGRVKPGEVDKKDEVDEEDPFLRTESEYFFVGN